MKKNFFKIFIWLLLIPLVAGISEIHTRDEELKKVSISVDGMV